MAGSEHVGRPLATLLAGGEALDLAAREWAVLEVLLARVEKIVSKEAIIQAVANWGEELTPNAIEVYLRSAFCNLT